MDEKTDGEMIAAALWGVAHAIEGLGLNGASTSMGAIELLAKEVKGVAEGLNEISRSVDLFDK